MGNFRIKNGSLPAQQTTDVDCGDGLLFIGAYSGCVLYFPDYWTTNIEKVAGQMEYLTLTKESSSRTVSIRNSQIYSYNWAYLGFY